MKVFITGATGLIGAHTTMELLRAGHQVRLLVRNRDKADRYFNARSIQIDDYVVADMMDEEAVRKGMQGCDAVIHAAAVVGVEKSRAEEIYQSNLKALHSVIDAAVAEGVENIIYVSTVSAFCNDTNIVASPDIDETAELFDQSSDAYRRSKTECEKHVRKLQSQGAPIQIIYPAFVVGPDDPVLNESNGALKRFATQVIPLCSSGVQMIDARDIAIAQRLMLEKGAPKNREQARYMIGGHFCPWGDFAGMLEQACGKWLFKLWLPDRIWLALGVLLDWLKVVIPIDFPLTREAAIFVSRWVPVNSDKLLREFDLSFRPLQETLDDTVRWMREAGHI